MSRLPRLKIYRSVLQRPTFTPERRGTLAHLCLEHLHLSGPGHEEADVDRAVAHALRLFPLPLEHPEEAAQSMRESLLWFARLACAAEPADRFEAVAANATEAFHAAPLAGGATLAGTPAPTAPFNLAELIASGLREQGLIDESGRRLRADLLVEQEHQVVVLDYKTGRPEPEHLEQIRAYMRLAGAALGKPSRGLLIYLDERRVLEVTP